MYSDLYVKMNNVEAMLRMYQRANPTLTRGECIELMKKKERHFLGYDIKLKPNKKRKKR
jgi:hypothetical protein